MTQGRRRDGPRPTSPRRPLAQQGKGTSVGTSSADSYREPVDPELDTALPADSGTGKRIVFSQDRQRVWLVSDDTTVLRTYPVSGSVYDNLHPGTFNVYSKSEDAWGVDDSGT